MVMSKQAASEIQEPTGGGEVPREEGKVGEGKGEKQEKELVVVENGGILPGPTMVVQSRTIRCHISSNVKAASTKNECFPSHVSLHLRLTRPQSFS